MMDLPHIHRALDDLAPGWREKLARGEAVVITNAPPNRQTAERRRGIFIPAGEVESHLLCGWTVIDESNDCSEALMAPPTEEAKP